MNQAYQQTIDWLFNQIPMFQNVGARAYKPGLDTVLRLSEAFGSPHLKLRAIHIAGTNGKGSTASTIAAVLRSAGYKTALYTSPHLVDFRERMRIDGKMISEDEVVAFIERFRSLNFEPQPSFFELTTVMAFDFFARNNVDYAVIETGLGGRLDATNILTPLLSVITNISPDHTALLGDTPAAIASEKAGIIKSGIPVVIGKAEGEVKEVFAEKARLENAPIIFAAETPAFSSFENKTSHILYKETPWGDICGELTGDCQSENANTALTALHTLLPELPAEAVSRGFAEVCNLSGLMGRWTTLQKSPQVICDTGHNPGGWEYLGPRLSQLAASDKLHIVIGFVNDKDVASILRMLPSDASYYFATPSVRRGRDSKSLKDEAAKFKLNGEAFPTVADAYQAALSSAHPSETIFVGGSTFIVADLLTFLN